VGRLGVDGTTLVDMSSRIIKQRIKMSAHGALFVTLPYNQEGLLHTTPKITYFGLLDDEQEEQEMTEELLPIIRSSLNEAGNDTRHVEKALSKYISRHFEKSPLIAVHCITHP